MAHFFAFFHALSFDLNLFCRPQFPFNVSSFKLIEGQIKELQGVILKTPGLRITKKAWAG